MENVFVKENCISKDELNRQLIQYFIDVQELEKEHITFVLTDFEDPYDTEWIDERYIGDYEIDGTLYEVRACKTDFYPMFETFTDDPSFKFYMLFNSEDITDGTVGSYRAARRWYITNPVDENDF